MTVMYWRCMVCRAVWKTETTKYTDDEHESIVRASCAPCGHQGCFERIPRPEVEKFVGDEDAPMNLVNRAKEVEKP